MTHDNTWALSQRCGAGAPIRKVKPEDKQHSDALSINAGLAAQQGIIRLAQAAACEERLDDGSCNEGQLWFLVRALCAEHGHDYDDMVRTGRAFANQL